jgi:hypothetical protein
VTRSVVVMQQPVLLSPKFGAKSSQCGIDCLACQDDFFANNPLDVKENYEHAPDFALHMSRLFRSRWVSTCHSSTYVWLMIPAPKACLIIARVSAVLLPRFAHKFDTVPLLDPSRNRIRPDTWPQIKGRKNTSTHLRDILYTDSQDMPVLSSTVASRYYNCCTGGSTSTGNYRYPLVCVNNLITGGTALPVHLVRRECLRITSLSYTGGEPECRTSSLFKY